MGYSTSLFIKISLGLSGIALATPSFISAALTQQPPQQQNLTYADGNRTEDIRRLPGKETVVDFRGVAKIAIPAVVSIKVKGVRKKPLNRGSLSDDSSDPFGGGDLWNFFGMPRQEARAQPFEGQASGVIVSKDGYILTNSHVVHEMNNITVQLHDGRELPAKVLGDDTNSELALIKVDAQNLPYLTLGNSDHLEVGQWVAAVGNPFGLQATLTVGVVSAKSRNNLDIARYEDFIQTDAAINRGNSGGPLITLDGEVIGINTAIATTADSGYIGIGFAIPSNMAKNYMEEILSNGKITRGFLGVSLQSVDYNLAKAFGLKKVEGALVSNVSKNSAADKAGLQVEDIILSINARPIENAASLRNAVYLLKPGTKVNLDVWRKDQQMQVPVVIGEYTETAAASTTKTNTSKSKKNFLGIEVGSITSEIAQQLGNEEDKGVGVVVTEINPSSPAALAGLKKGALIFSINRQKISTVEEFDQAIAAASKESSTLLQIKQGDLYLFLSLQNPLSGAE